jgi:hypothetical protein
MKQIRSRITLQTLLVGLVAGMIYGMLEMVIEAVIGHGFWSPLHYIASVFTLGRDTDASFAFFPVVVGLMGHIMNSVLLGLLFALVISRLVSTPLGLVVAGMVYGGIIFAVMWFGLLPLIDPAMLRVNPVGFFVSHLMYGVVLGAGLAWLRRSALVVQPARA